MNLQPLLFGLGALPYAVLTAQPTWRAHGGELADHARVGPGDHVLDLGCGPGESAFGMVERVPGLRVTGLDLSPVMIRIAKLRQRYDRAGSHATFVVGDAMALPFADASFDAVTGHSFLYLVPDAVQVLREVRRVLRPRRRCVFLEPASRAENFPKEIAMRFMREPRFVTSLALWTLASRRFGRFDEARFRQVFADAELESVGCQATLGGLGIFGSSERAAS